MKPTQKPQDMNVRPAYNSDNNMLGWIVGVIGIVYLFIFIYFTFSGNIQAQIVSGVTMVVIMVIDMLIFKLTEYTGGENII